MCYYEEIYRSVSLRGLLDAMDCMQRGLKPLWAFEVGLINKAFDPYERTVVSDTVKTRIPEKCFFTVPAPSRYRAARATHHESGLPCFSIHFNKTPHETFTGTD